ncbi:MAG: hypothetical protein ABUL49_00225, partial [bacterium]
EQVSSGYSSQFEAKDVVEKRAAECRRIIEAIRATKKVPDDVPTELKALFPGYLAKYLSSVFTLSPADRVGELAVPVLVVQAESDVQVSPKSDAPALMSHLKEGTLVSIPGASHNLKHVENKKELGFEGPVVPGVLDQISDWLSKHV